MKQQFPVMYEWPGKSFSGFAPDVPGCAVTARTPAKMRSELKGALEALLQWMNDEGDSIPHPSPFITVDMAEDKEFPDPPGYYVIVEQLAIAVPTKKQARSRKVSGRQLTAA